MVEITDDTKYKNISKLGKGYEKPVNVKMTRDIGLENSHKKSTGSG